MCKGRTKRGKKLFELVWWYGAAVLRGRKELDGTRRDAVRGERWMTWAHQTFPPSPARATKILATKRSNRKRSRSKKRTRTVKDY